MLTGLALAVADVPLLMIQQLDLGPRVVERDGEPEVQFPFRDAERVLSVWHEGRLQLATGAARVGRCR